MRSHKIFLYIVLRFHIRKFTGLQGSELQTTKEIEKLEKKEFIACNLEIVVKIVTTTTIKIMDLTNTDKYNILAYIL